MLLHLVHRRAFGGERADPSQRKKTNRRHPNISNRCQTVYPYKTEKTRLFEKGQGKSQRDQTLNETTLLSNEKLWLQTDDIFVYGT